MDSIDLCRDSLDGLSVGDALGAQFFVPGTSYAELVAGRPPRGPWPWTDDTEMACTIVSELQARGDIDPDHLATAFAQRYELRAVLEHLVESRVSEGIQRAVALLGASVAEPAYELGNGARVLAQDTVPFTLWAAATFLHDYPAAVLACIEAGGDVDTTASIVGGVVATFTGTGPGGVPSSWLTAREPLPTWASYRG